MDPRRGKFGTAEWDQGDDKLSDETKDNEPQQENTYYRRIRDVQLVKWSCWKCRNSRSLASNVCKRGDSHKSIKSGAGHYGDQYTERRYKRLVWDKATTMWGLKEEEICSCDGNDIYAHWASLIT
jgi:hypothetical protein